MLDIIPWLLGFGLVALAWWDALGARTAARRGAQRACADAQVRFIDELAIRKLGVGRDGRGRLRLKRVYGFEFYWEAGRRHGGEVVVHAQCVTRVSLDPYPLT